MTNTELIEQFYTAFSEGNMEGMTSCYHKDVTFKDPVFGELKGDRAFKMWEMLLSKRTDSTKISFENIQAHQETVTARWTAKYLYGEKKRKVINIVNANFKFKDGKIIEHTDTFSVWKWSKQALGAAGLLLGWTPFMKNKIQKTTKEQLDQYMGKQ